MRSRHRPTRAVARERIAGLRTDIDGGLSSGLGRWSPPTGRWDCARQMDGSCDDEWCGVRRCGDGTTWGSRGLATMAGDGVRDGEI